MGEWPKVDWAALAAFPGEGDDIPIGPRRNVLGTSALTPPILANDSPLMTNTTEAEASEMAIEWKWVDFSSSDLRQAFCDGLDGALLSARNHRVILHRERPRHPYRSGGRPLSDDEWSIRREQQDDYIQLIAERIHDFEQDPVHVLRSLANDLERMAKP